MRAGARPRRPCPRRNHGFAPRLQSGADAEAILSEAPVGPRSTRVAAPGFCPAPAPEPGDLPAETVISLAGRPAYPTPARVRWRPRRRALPVSGSAVTRAALAPPRATSPASQAGRSLSAKQRGLGTPQSPPSLGQARQTGGPRAEAAVTKRLLCRPARPAAVAETAPARRAGPAAPPPPLPAWRGQGSRCLRQSTANPVDPSVGRPAASRPGRPQGRSPVPSCRRPTGTASRGGGERTPGSEQRRRWGWGGRPWSPGPRGGCATDTHRNMFTH